MKEIKMDEVYLPTLEEEHKIGISTKKALSLFDPYEFEAFICEWIKYCRYKNKKISVYNIGGTGDHGIDILVSEDGEEKIYQCKRYEKPLSECEVKTIITKILWYYFKDFNKSKYPKSIEVICLNDFKIGAARVFNDKSSFKKEILLYYETALKNEKIKYVLSDLDEFKNYLRGFDYNRTMYTKIEDVIKDYRMSEVSFFRFKDVKPSFKRVDVESFNEIINNDYENQILNVLSSYGMEDEAKSDYINNCKREFYSAFSLRETCYYFFGKYDEFQKIESNVMSLIDTLKFDEYKTKFHRMQTILKEVKSLNLDDSFLVYSLHMVNYLDRKGTCHWLVNNGKFNWEK